MSYGRLLLPVLLLCTFTAFAQDQPLRGGDSSRKVQPNPEFRTPPASTANEPWRIIPKSDNDHGFVMTMPEMGSQGIVVTPDGPLAADVTCLAIRSYMVKRDSKDSDSVHPAGYTTCVPAARFHLKTAEAHASLTR